MNPARGRRWRSIAVQPVLATMILAGGLLLADAGRATFQFGTVQLSGNLETQNLIRTPEFGDVQFIQNRNTVRIRVDWDWIQDGRFVERFDIPWIRESRFYLLYRGVYDGFYDLAPGGRQTGQAREDDLIGGAIEGNLAGTCREGNAVTGELLFPCFGANPMLREGLYSRFDEDARDARKYENRIREIYVDVTLRDLPLTLRLGRQQVIWGEADQFRLMDIWNPLDVQWRFPVADTFDEFRVPLWLAKGILDTGTIGPLYNTFVEVVYNPFDFQPGQKVDWLPRPWSLPFPNPVRAGQVQVAQPSPLLPPLFITPTFNLQGTSFWRGDFERNPAEASEVGARFHFVTPQGFESTVNYIYGRGKWVGTSPAFGVEIDSIIAPNLTDPPLPFTFAGRPVLPATVNAEIVHPYVHVFGLTGNYFEADYTQSVLRMETAYALGEPYPSTAEEELTVVTDSAGNPVPLFGCPPTDPRCFQKSPVGLEMRDVWAGMIGFDRPTWIRWLNNKATWFISMQFFWMHVPGGGIEHLRGFSSSKRPPYFTPDPASCPRGAPNCFGDLAQTQGFGVWDTGPFAGLVERVQQGNTRVVRDSEGRIVDVVREGAPSDDVKRWEFMTTLTATTFYRGGTIAPQIVTLFDPVNLWIAPMFQLQYLYTNDLIITLQERIFVPMDPPTNDPWFVGRFGRRAETGIRVTYQF